MLSIKKVLFPTDFSESANHAMTWALMFAKNFEAHLDMLHAVVLHADDVGEEVFARFPDIDKCIDSLMKNADTRFEKTIEDSGQLSIKQHVRRGLSKVEEILNFAEEAKSDLIVMGSHGHSGITQALLGSVTEKVVRGAHCPVLTVRKPKYPKDTVDVKRIVLPIDFSDHCKIAIKYGVVLAKLLGVKLEVVHVMDTQVHPAYFAVGLDSPSKLDSDLNVRIKESMKKFMLEEKVMIDFEMTVLEGIPFKEICEFADHKEDSLVIISAHGSSMLERFMIGSTTDRVIRKAESPVLIIKSDARDFVK